MTMEVVPGKGTVCARHDYISGSASSPTETINGVKQPRPFINCSVWWLLDWGFKTENPAADEYTFINNVTQKFTIEVTDPILNLVIFRITKAQSGAQIGSSDLFPMFIEPEQGGF